LGDFTVDCLKDAGDTGGAAGGYIIRGDKMPGLGDAARQGHPFYCGAMSYETEIAVDKSAPGARTFVRLDGFHGPAAKAYLNGKPVSAIGWDPYEADITDFATHGKNSLRIDVFSSGQNIFGPHARVRMPGRVTPGSFFEPDDGTFASYGLYGGVTVITRI
jgi:hypothetical protein